MCSTFYQRGKEALFMLCALIHGTTEVGRHWEDTGAQGILEPLRAARQHPCWQLVIPVHRTGFFYYGLKATWLQMKLSCSARRSSPECLLQAWFYQNTCTPFPTSSRLPMEPWPHSSQAHWGPPGFLFCSEKQGNYCSSQEVLSVWLLKDINHFCSQLLTG